MSIRIALAGEPEAQIVAILGAAQLHVRGEHRIGGREHRAEYQRHLPIEAEKHRGDDRHAGDRDRHRDRRQPQGQAPAPVPDRDPVMRRLLRVLACAVASALLMIGVPWLLATTIISGMTLSRGLSSLAPEPSEACSQPVTRAEPLGAGAFGVSDQPRTTGIALSPTSTGVTTQ